MRGVTKLVCAMRTATLLDAKKPPTVLYLRHRLQKGFLMRDQTPKEDEMASMSDFLTQLENYTNLEPSIIRGTKIYKVLRGIIKLSFIPKEEEYQFKKRSNDLLASWHEALGSKGDDKEDEKAEEKPEEKPEQKENGEKNENADADAGKTETTELAARPAETATSNDAAADKDVAMSDAKEEKPEEKTEEKTEAPADAPAAAEDETAA